MQSDVSISVRCFVEWVALVVGSLSLVRGWLNLDGVTSTAECTGIFDQSEGGDISS